MRLLEDLKESAKRTKKRLIAIMYAYQDSRLDILPKVLIGIAILYALSPIDLIPDFIPVLGYLDDVLIVPALINLAVRLIPKSIMDAAIRKAEKEPIEPSKNWTFGVIFIGIWVLVIFLMAKAVIGLAPGWRG